MNGRLSTARLTAVAAAVVFVPLALLTYFSLRLATDAVTGEVESRLESTASLSAAVVAEELRSLTLLVESYAARPSLVASVRSGADDRTLRFHLRGLQQARPGVAVAFVARLDGRLVDIVPATPSIVGRDFSFRDWYRGVTRTGRTYVSEAYVTQAVGAQRVVAAAVHVRSRGRPVAILVAGYSLEHLQRISDDVAKAQNVMLNVTDQRGVLVAAPGGLPSGLVSRRNDPRVAEALHGRSGVVELDTADGRRLSAHTPAPPFGWTVTASVPPNTAFAAVSSLRTTVLTIAALLAVLLLAGLALLAKSLRERRRAEEESRRQVGINEAVLEATTDGIALVDADGRLTVANGTFRRLIGDMLGRPVDLGKDAPMADVSEEVAARTTDAAGYRAAAAALRADPERIALDEFRIVESGRTFLRYTAPVRDDQSEYLGRLIVVREVTAERDAERLKSDLLATVSHELRTPLTGILGFAELLVRQDPGRETRERYLGTIYGEAKRLTALINDFLDLQRIESGAFALSLEPFDLKDVLEHQVNIFSGQSAAHRIELRVSDEPLVVVGEAERVAQVVANLLSNAIKYSPGGGDVEVEAEQRDGFVRVRVRDHGLGIPADQQASVFDKFFRVDTSDTRKIGGTGLGLALAREIVEAHAGGMGFDSVYGEGSTFWFELPSGQRPDGRRGRILVVEDDAPTALLLAEHLAGGGFAVETVRTGDEAIARAKDAPPAAICLDIRLEGDIDGWQVLAALKAHAGTANVPVVVCTGGNNRGRAAALGASDFLTKPFSGEQLLEALTRLLPQRRGDVLIVEDEAHVRRLIVDTLAGSGFESREASDGIEALEQLSASHPDAVVLDLIMPGLDGFAVLEHMQKDPETRLIPVIVLTAKRLSEDERRALSAQAVALLDKSFYSAQELVGLVTQAIGEPER